MVSERVILKSFTKKLDHLGVIAAVVEELGIVELVNERLPKLRHHTLTHGDVVLALILNGLGFTQRRLYLFPAYLENKSVQRLFRKDITADDFNDDVIGRTLDAIKEYGPEKLYQEIIGRIDGKPAIGLPGYPIAALTAVRELALPLLAEWGFHARPGETLRARLAGTVVTDPGFDEFVLLTVSRATDRYDATPLPGGAGTQMTAVRANAYLHVPAGTGSICEGTEVEVLLTGARALIRESAERREPAPERPVQGGGAGLPVRNDS